MDPDPEGPKTHGSDVHVSGSVTQWTGMIYSRAQQHSDFDVGNAGCAVPREVDSSRGHSVRKVHRQVRRLVLWGPTHGALHLRTGPLPRYRNMFMIRIGFNPDPAF
jgi:hypothetical protein